MLISGETARYELTRLYPHCLQILKIAIGAERDLLGYTFRLYRYTTGRPTADALARLCDCPYPSESSLCADETIPPTLLIFYQKILCHLH